MGSTVITHFTQRQLCKIVLSRRDKTELRPKGVTRVITVTPLCNYIISVVAARSNVLFVLFLRIKNDTFIGLMKYNS